MTSTVPPRDWTEIHWPDIASGRRRALDRGAAAGGDRTARPASAAGNRRPDRRGLSGAGARAVACSAPRHLSARAAGRHLHRAYRLSRHADAADRRRIEGMDGDRRERRAIRHPQAGDGDEPWRQQRGDVAGGAGSARASSDARGHHELVSLRRAGWIVFRRRDRGMAFMAARPRRRSCWRAIRRACGRKRSPIFVPPASRWRRNFAGSRRIGRSPFAWQTQDLHESGAVGDATKASAEKGEQLLDHGARAFCELLDDVDKFDPELFLRKP